MGKVDTYGPMESYMKGAFGSIKDKVREKYNTQMTVVMKDTGETIKGKAKECFFKVIQP